MAAPLGECTRERFIVRALFAPRVLSHSTAIVAVLLPVALSAFGCRSGRAGRETLFAAPRQPATTPAVLVSQNGSMNTTPPSPPSPPRRTFPPVRGVVEDAAGRPVPGVTVYLPYWDAQGPEAADGVVTAGPDGTFVWQRPGFPFNPDVHPPDARVASHDAARWTMTPVVVQPQSDIPLRTREMLREMLRPAKTRWEGTGEAARLVVESPPLGEAVAVVRGPDGRALADAPVQVWLGGRWPDGDPGHTVRYAGKTDPAGRVALRFFPGPRELVVAVPGVGWGTTERFEVVSGRAVTPDLGRLVPWGTIAGRVAPEIARPGQIVRLGRFHETDGDPAWSWRQTRTDRNGRFLLRDVTPGRHAVWLFDTEADAAEWTGYGRARSRHTVTVAPGAGTSEVALYPLPARTAPAPPMSAASPADPQTPGVLTGIVRNAAGRPVAGATVWAVCTTYGIRAMHTTLQATSGPDGTYRLEGVPARGGMSPEGGVPVILAAFLAGHPPALAHVAATERAAPAAPDLVVPDNGGTLSVRVLGPNGAPRAGAVVEAAPDVASVVPGSFYVGNRSRDTSAALRRALVPRAVTDASGSVRFEHLLPGRYALTAAGPTSPTNGARPGGFSGEDSLDAYRLLRGGEGREVAFAAGVPVGPSGESRHALRLQKKSVVCKCACCCRTARPCAAGAPDLLSLPRPGRTTQTPAGRARVGRGPKTFSTSRLASVPACGG